MRMKKSSESQIILGIDPGTQTTGYGLICVESHRIVLLDFGCIRPPKSHTPAEKYLAIFEGVNALLEKYAPVAISVESQFFHKNAQSALKLGMAKGAALISAARKKIPVYEYAPRKAKLAVVGNGAASKEQVQKMLQLLLNLSSLPEPEDAADALALAICHAHASKFNSKVLL